MGGYRYSPWGGGYGWMSSAGTFTGYTYGPNPYSSFGWQSSLNPYR
jgi:hypothetical protein